MDKYKDYLAINVINEQKIVSYRQLSRALGVHVDTAKQMLYTFHKDINAKRKNQVHATYTIIGTRVVIRSETAAGDQNDEDVDMDANLLQSSAPEMSQTRMETTLVTAMILAQEEDLDAALDTFEEVTTLSVYSLEPSRLEDIQVLSTCNDELRRMPAGVDALEAWKIYGAIHDPNCQRRIPGKASTMIATAAASSVAAKAPVAVAAAASKSTKPPPASTTKSAPAKPPGPASKSKAKSNPFANFKPTPKPADEPRLESDDDDNEEDDFPITKPTASNRPDPKERMRKLREEMDQAERDEAAAEAKAQADAAAQAEASTADSDGDEDMLDAPPPPTQQPEKPGAEQNVEVTNGRRRGRRKIVKKKTVKDEEGYLVTKEEQVWESFSEEEPVPKKAKPNMPAAAAKKGGAKPGQAGIHSFFKKKP